MYSNLYLFTIIEYLLDKFALATLQDACEGGNGLFFYLTAVKPQYFQLYVPMHMIKYWKFI